jgi:inner membrane protein YidH
MPDQFPSESTLLARDRTDLAGDRTDLGHERTILAHDRTLMAWIRTATSLISFGFSIYKFFDLSSNTGAGTHGLFGTRAYALYMIGIGLTALTLASIQHRMSLDHLRKSGPVPRSLTLLVALLVAFLGVVSFVLVMLRQ